MSTQPAQPSTPRGWDPADWTPEAITRALAGLPLTGELTTAQQQGFYPPTADEQAPVIEAPLEPALVVAGAGSGKTKTMADRVVFQVATGEVKPDEVLGVTFTKKAAAELRERVISRLRLLAERHLIDVSQLLEAHELEGIGSTEGMLDLLAPNISTYHSYASSLVTEYGVHLGLEPEVTVITEAESWQIVTELIANYERTSATAPLVAVGQSASSLAQQVLKLAGDAAEHSIDDFGTVIEHLDTEIDRVGLHFYAQEDLEVLLGRTVDPAALIPLGPGNYQRNKKRNDPEAPGTLSSRRRSTDEDGNPTPSGNERGLFNTLLVRRETAILAARYQAAKEEQGVMDFGDLLRYAVRIAKNPQVQQAEREKYRLILLDEFQDTSTAQLTLFSELFGGVQGLGVTAVGDPNQSIYGFRGASSGQLFSFLDTFTWQDESGHQQKPRTYELTKAFRNGSRILTVANALVEPLRTVPDDAHRWQLHKREAKNITPLSPGKGENHHPGQVKLGWFESDHQEADAVASVLKERLACEAGATCAVLARKRAHLHTVAQALEAHQVDYEFIGLSGLLSTPEVAEVLSYLHVMANASASDHLGRILAGARYQVSPRDLMALHEAAEQSSRLRMAAQRNAEGSGAQVHQSLPDMPSLVEALDKLPAQQPEDSGFTERGFAQLKRAQADIRVLRRTSVVDIPTLVEHIITQTGLSVELMSKPGTAQHLAQAQLNELISHAEGYVQNNPQAELPGFLQWLTAAEEKEKGLNQAPEEPKPGAVQLLTAHASKGLEWNVVAVVGMRKGQFPSSKADRWTNNNGHLPWRLRGDAESLPQWENQAPSPDHEPITLLTWASSAGAASANSWKLYKEEVTPEQKVADKPELSSAPEDEQRHLNYIEQTEEYAMEEERRLGYVAVTRAEELLMVTGARFYGTSGGDIPGEFLQEIARQEGVEIISALPEGLLEDPESFDEKEYKQVPNPKAQGVLAATWPFDPLAQLSVRRFRRHGDPEKPWRPMVLEPVEDAPEPGQLPSRRPALQVSRAAVAEAMEALEQSTSEAGELPPAQNQLEHDVDFVRNLHLESLRPAARQEFPDRMSVSRMVQTGGHAQDVAEQYRRPIPQEPAPQMRRGTTVHALIEDYFGHQAQLPDAEDPATNVEYLGVDFDRDRLLGALQASEWGECQISAMEIPLKTAVDSVVVNGRVDAVFGRTSEGEEVSHAQFQQWMQLPRQERNQAMAACSWELVDWKTGRPPRDDEDLGTKQIQLAIYTLAFSENFGVPVEQITSAFFYVDHGQTVRPVKLQDKQELVEIMRSGRAAFEKTVNAT